MKGFDEAWLRENYWGAEEALANAKPVNVLTPDAPRRKAAHTKGVMNETEKRFARLLDDGLWPWAVAGWAFESEVLQLSPDMTYCPDFNLTLDDGSLQSIDTKGAHTWEDSIVKAKAAAVIVPGRSFFLTQLKSGEWRVRQVGVKPTRKFTIPA